MCWRACATPDVPSWPIHSKEALDEFQKESIEIVVLLRIYSHMTAVTPTADGCINIKVRNFVPRRKIFNWESTLDVQTHYKDRKTFQCTNFYTFHPSGANKEFVKGEVLHLLGTNSSRSTFNKKRTEFQNTHKEWRLPRWQFWEVYLRSYFCRWERLAKQSWEHKEENNFFLHNLIRLCLT